MKGTFSVDPEQCAYGAATDGVRRILVEWIDIDWFVPPSGDGAAARARALFLEHNALARLHQPEVFPAHVDVCVERGGFAELAALTSRARAASGWDWKFSALKKLSHEHSKARGWSLAAEAPDVVSRSAALGTGAGPLPGDLFFRFGEIALWSHLGPALPLGELVPPEGVEPAGWYLGYATIDLAECLEWQLAERSSDGRGNPFIPLLGCYREGFYPFSQGRSSMTLFAFDR